MWLIDLDEYRPGAFVLDSDRLPDGPSGWRGTTVQRAVVDRATRPDPAARHATVAALVRDWRAA